MQIVLFLNQDCIQTEPAQIYWKEDAAAPHLEISCIYTPLTFLKKNIAFLLNMWKNNKINFFVTFFKCFSYIKKKYQQFIQATLRDDLVFLLKIYKRKNEKFENIYKNHNKRVFGRTNK